MTIEIPDNFADIRAEFSPQEAKRLRTILRDPVYLKLEAKAESMKPSARCAGAGSTTRDAFSEGRAQARLSEIHGWECRRAAIFAALLPPPPKREQVTESFQPVVNETV